MIIQSKLHLRKLFQLISYYTSVKKRISRRVKFLKNKNVNEKIETQLNFKEKTPEESEKSQYKSIIEIKFLNTEDTPSKFKQSTSESMRSDTL